jgi:hypothetical protein
LTKDLRVGDRAPYPLLRMGQIHVEPNLGHAATIKS